MSPDTDRLIEAGRILRGETRMLATIEHLEALRMLVREAAREFSGLGELNISDWLRDAAKLEPPV